MGCMPAPKLVGIPIEFEGGEGCGGGVLQKYRQQPIQFTTMWDEKVSGLQIKNIKNYHCVKPNTTKYAAKYNYFKPHMSEMTEMNTLGRLLD